MSLHATRRGVTARLADLPLRNKYANLCHNQRYHLSSACCAAMPTLCVAGKPGVRLTLEDLQSQFGVGLKEAANRLGICLTTLKRACRWAG